MRRTLRPGGYDTLRAGSGWRRKKHIQQTSSGVYTRLNICQRLTILVPVSRLLA